MTAIAADGDIRDNAPALHEFRDFLRLVRSEKLFDYAHQCLDDTHCGDFLQEIVNELGRRLGFDVENGLLKGKHGAIGFDGIWRLSGEPEIVVEVKTSDVFAVHLETPNEYRKKLIEERKISNLSSVLIVIGRIDDEGSLAALEAMVKGSEFSHTTRLISVEGLIRLVEIHKIADIPDTTTKQIWRLLHPVEYIQLDKLIDVIFSTRQGQEETTAPEVAADSDVGPRVDRTIIEAKRQEAIAAFSALKNCDLIQRSRTFYWTEDKKLRVCCTVSKRYENAAQPYFYAYHPKWDDFLKEGEGF